MIHDPVLAHELRTPLHGVLAAAALLLDDTLTAEQRELAETIHEAANALLRLADTSLGIGDAAIDDACDPRVIVDGVRRLLDAPARAKGLTLQSSVDDDVPVALGIDGGQLRQVLVNLVGNAVKFTVSGTVSVRVRRVDADVRFEVRDSGPGLDAGQQATLFQPRDVPNEKPNESPTEAPTEAPTGTYSSAGLGLSISAALVRRMGGTIGVTSAAGEGSTFWVELPVVESQMRPSFPRRRESIPLRGTRGIPADAGMRVQGAVPNSSIATVLLLDDDVVGRRVTARMLQRLGCRVDEVGRIVDAEEALRRGRYDVVLLDCALPDGDGTGIARWVRRGEGGGTPIRLIALTASPDAATRARCLAAGMDACLVKPVSLDALAVGIAVPVPPRSALRETADAQLARAASDPVIDAARMDALAQLDDDAPGLLASIAVDYAAGAARQLAAIETAIGARDMGALRRAAHLVSGSSASAGASRAAALAAAIERAAARHAAGDADASADVTAAIEAVDALHDAVRDAAAALERHASARPAMQVYSELRFDVAS